MTEKFTAQLCSLNLWIGSAVVAFVEKFLFNNWNYLAFLVVAMGCDLITGVWKARIKQEKITSKGLRDTVTKVIQYGTFLVITHVLINFSTVAERFEQLKYIGDVAYTFLILIEIISVYENIMAMNGKFSFLKGIIAKIQALIDKS